VTCRRNWDSQVPFGFRRFFGGGRCVVCPRVEDEFSPKLSSRGKGLCSLIPRMRQVFMHSEGEILDTIVIIGVREGRVYRLQG
jgi:hypothetical protein